MAKINAEWHKAHRMPRNATLEQRVTWHLEHLKHCACRPDLPKSVAAEIQRRLAEVTGPRRRVDGQSIRSLAALAIFLTLAGCGDHRSPEAKTATAPVTPATPAGPETDAWLGQWNGPEGTFLRLTPGTGGVGSYEVTIQNLDGPRSFLGTAVGREIQFDRDGVRESLRATDGAGTGMKWLAEKANCLAVRVGEGYCRD